MESRSVRERLNSIIIRLDKATKLPAKERKLAKKGLQDWVDRELAECPRKELDELPNPQFYYLFSKISELLRELGIVAAVVFAVILSSLE